MLSVDGREPGAELRVEPEKSVTLRVEALDPRPLARLEVIANGTVVGSSSQPDQNGRWVVELQKAFSTNTWIAARAFEPAGSTIRFAHTSPIYVDVGRPSPTAADAKFFLDWIDREIAFYKAARDFQREEDRAATLGFFQSARDVYARLAR